MTFHGAPRAEEVVMAHVHESPKVMILPLVVLAAGAIGFGLIGFNWFVGEQAVAFWGNSIFVLEGHNALEAAHHVPVWAKFSPLVVAFAGIGLAYLMYVFAPALPAALASGFRRSYDFLMAKWYFDELYDFLFVKPAFVLGRGFWKSGDGDLIDGVGPDGLAAATRNIARRAGAMQSGFLYHYVFAMLAGLVILLTWYLMAGG
jgi:NADH-quinone oxidoreductase subunit L